LTVPGCGRRRVTNPSFKLTLLTRACLTVSTNDERTHHTCLSSQGQLNTPPGPSAIQRELRWSVMFVGELKKTSQDRWGWESGGEVALWLFVLLAHGTGDLDLFVLSPTHRRYRPQPSISNDTGVAAWSPFLAG